MNSMPRLLHLSAPQIHSRRKIAPPLLLLTTWLLLLTTIGSAGITPTVQAATDPSAITGLRLWLDAADPDGDANASNNPAAGTALTTWRDKSGNNSHATVASGQSAGTYESGTDAQINGVPVVRFTRSSQYLGSIYSVAGVDIRANTMPDVTIFTVYRLADNPSNQTALWGIDDGDWDRFFYARFTSFGDGIDDGIAGLGPVQQGAVVPDSGQSGGVHLLTAVYDGTVAGGSNNGPLNGSTVYFDGRIVTRFTDSTHPSNAQTSFFLGWDGNDNPFKGDIAEVLIYNRALSGVEVGQINQYLSEKYNQTFQAAAPGGVNDPASNNLALWMRADAGVTGTSNVTVWADQGPANRSATSADGPSRVSDSINGNPVLRFNGSSDQLAISGGIFGAGSYTGGDVYVLARTSQLQNSSVLAEQVTSGSFSAALPYGDGTARWSAGAATLQAPWGGQLDQPYLWSMRNGAAGTNAFAIYRNGALLAGNASSGAFAGASQATSIGSTFDGDIAEIAIYSSPLATPQHARVQSYLALKYGISLGGQNYTASDATVVWDNTANANFSNNIAGIGKDKASSLAQLTSRSVDSGVLSITARTADVADKEFLVWGDNNAPLAISNDVPAGYTQRLQRIWYIQETGQTGSLTSVSFDLTGVAGVKFNRIDQFALLIDNDASFANATAIDGATLNGNTIIFSGVDLGDGAYLSLAYPAVALTVIAPAQGTLVGLKPGFSGTAAAGSTITVREGSTVLCQATALVNGSWSCTPASNLSEATHTISVTATDTEGDTSAAISRTFRVSEASNLSFLPFFPIGQPTQNTTNTK